MSAMANNPFGLFSADALGKAIRAERMALGCAQQWVADQCKLRRQTIADLEHGENVELFTVIAVLTALGKGLRVVHQNMSIEEAEEFFREPD